MNERDGQTPVLYDRRQAKERIRREVASLKVKFTLRQSAASFTALSDSLNETYGASLITTPQSGFYKEAWLASRFGNFREASHIWLGEDPPDFYLEIDGASFGYEATEVLRPGRKRDLEIHAVYEKGPMPDPEDEWLSIEENLSLLSAAISQKDGKNYRGIHGLLVYLDTGWIRSNLGVSEAVDELLARAAELSLKVHSFAEVWVACSTRCHRII